MNLAEKSRESYAGRSRDAFLRRLPFVRPLIRKEDGGPASMISVDYPKKTECIMCPEYTFRIETASPDAVEISIDGEDWRACRKAVGYWWYDWANYRSGVHQAVVRLRPRAGEKTPSQTCLFRVDLLGVRG